MTKRRFLSGKIATLLVLIFLFFPGQSASAVELKPTFNSSYNTNGPYDNRWQAEQDIWNAAGWPGSELALPLYMESIQAGQRTLYTVQPEFVPKLEIFDPVYYTGTNVNCADCPIYDKFGNPRCSAGQFQYCANESGIEDALQNQFDGGAYCDWYVESQTPWTFADYTGAGPGLPDGTQIYGVKHQASRVIRYWQKNYNCLTQPAEYGTWNWDSVAQSWTSCPTGYYDAGTLNDGQPSCSNHFGAYLYEYNPVEFGGNCAAGNPCYPKTGAKSLSETDFSSPTLNLTRSWNSFSRYKHDSAMGRGWTHNYAQRILAFAGTSPPVRKLVDGEGAVEYFDCTDDPVCTVYRSRKNAGWLLKPDGSGWEVLAPGGERRLFNSNGQLTQIEQRGASYSLITLSYVNGKLNQVTDQSGRSLSFNYNTDGLVGSVTLPSGSYILYDYKQPASIPSHVTWQKQLTRVTREDLSERIYHYEDQFADATPRFEFLLTGITDENGVRFATYTYDDSARVINSGHAGGAGLVTLNYTRRPGESEDWTITEVTRPLGEVVTYEMNPGPFRKLSSLTDTRGTLSINYDPATTWRTGRTDHEGNRTTYAYADGLHQTSRTEAAGTPDERIIETDWDNTINRIKQRREPGKTTTYTYNTRGQVLTRTETDTGTHATRVWTYTYIEAPAGAELAGRLNTEDGPRTDVSDVTIYDYYSSDDPGGLYRKGDLHTITNAMGHVTGYLAYDGDGRPLQVSDANGVISSMSYHQRGWIASRTTDGQTTSFTYDQAGKLTRVTQPDGAYTSYEYDDAHRLDAISDNFNNRVEYTLDADGNHTAENTFNDQGVLRRQVSRVYDQLSRLQKVIDGNFDETVYGYDSNGNRSSSRDPNLNTTRFEYDPLDRLVKTIDATLGETLVEYDDRNNLVAVIDPLGNKTANGFDGLDNQVRLDSPDTGITVYEYDDAGNRIATTDARNVRVEYSYDALNRLVFTDYAENSLDISLTYDAGTYGKGRLTSMSDAAGTETYSYDARGNLTGVVRDINGTIFTTRYAYNGADRLVQIIYASGMVIDYTLDATGRVTAMDKTINTISESLVTGVVYEPFGPVKSFTFGNDLSMNAGFDLDFQLDNLQSGAALDWQFQYDDSGNILTITDQATPGNNQAFTYDDLYRLKTASGGYGNESYQYDANGNRTGFSSDVVDDPYTYAPQSNRLATRNGWRFSRDAVGNRLDKLDDSGNGKFYSYGDHGRLIQVTDRDSAGDTVAGTYLYDGRGQRSSKSSGGVVTIFIYGSHGELHGEYHSDGTPIKEYVYLSGQPVATIESRYELIFPPVDIVQIDNGDPGTSSAGLWTSRTSSQHLGVDYLDARKKANNSYLWTPSLTGSTYHLSAWWVAKNKHSSRVEYTIDHSGGTSVVVKNHRADGGQWNLLGTYSGIRSVEVNAANGKTVVDGLRFVELVDPPFPQRTQTTRFIHTDHLGTPRAVTDEVQAVVWRWDSRPFGDSAPDEDPDGDGNDFTLNLRFPGQYYDAESGLNYNYFRDYDPGTGRYVESDPIGIDGGVNPFSYVINSPLQFLDPVGLKTTGRWIEPPRMNIISYGIDGWEIVRGSWSWWGYIKFIRLHGYVDGFVNIDVECNDRDTCGEQKWEIHDQIHLFAEGSFDIGPNAYALAALKAGGYAGAVTQIIASGGAALIGGLGLLEIAHENAAWEIAMLYAHGPTGICLGSGAFR
jgi:RHS repeat-associated protein